MKTLAIILAAAAIMFVENSVALERLEPPTGCYFGFTITDNQRFPDLTTRMGFTPAVYSGFFSFPLNTGAPDTLNTFLTEVSKIQGIAMLTFEPWGGLESVTDKDCTTLAELCAAWESRGLTGIFIRFAHEMNGSWYVWGQKPILYKATFRKVAQAVHARTKRTAMVWAPNYGVGYPFDKTGPTSASAEDRALDTNGDGRITDRDDPYAPYYPGDDVVDWVGMTIYHWGVLFPWFENEMPLPGSFAGSLTGTFQGSTPNFYAEYSVSHRKPLMIPETAAFYNTEQPGPDPLLLKQAWWRQVFAEAINFPNIKSIIWFNEFKRESIAQNNLIDWRVSGDERIRSTFIRDLFSVSENGHPYFLTAQKAHCIGSAYCISAELLPQTLPTTGEIAVSLEVSAATDCDLVIDLLDSTFHWVGGTRLAISAPGQSVITSFTLVEKLTEKTNYRWSIFLTPSARDYRNALAWYTGPNPSVGPDGMSNPLNTPELSIKSRGANAVLTWPSTKGRSYQLLYSPDIKSWTPLDKPLPGNGEPLDLTIEPNSTDRRGFYRVQIVP